MRAVASPACRRAPDVRERPRVPVSSSRARRCAVCWRPRALPPLRAAVLREELADDRLELELRVDRLVDPLRDRLEEPELPDDLVVLRPPPRPRRCEPPDDSAISHSPFQ